MRKLESFRARLDRERDTKDIILDTEYALEITFENRAQVIAFQEWLGPAFMGKYVDGPALAERLGVDIGERQVFPRIPAPKPALAALAAWSPPDD